LTQMDDMSNIVDIAFISFFFLIIPRPPRSTLFTYTTLFRSKNETVRILRGRRRVDELPCADALQSENGLRERIWRRRRLRRQLRSEEHTSELQSRRDLVCRLLLEKKKKNTTMNKKSSEKT